MTLISHSPNVTHQEDFVAKASSMQTCYVSCDFYFLLQIGSPRNSIIVLLPLIIQTTVWTFFHPKCLQEFIKKILPPYQCVQNASR